ncbi:MAG TPA: Lrp/AsnC family transcriptional regulator [Ramlibacter sp.]|nr:Lrp/AsnC family transcriptional regulator [Ramlibacter sp.]
MPIELDAHDRQLLALIQEDAACTAEQLAQAVPLSASAIQRRLKRLREEGIVQREVAVLDAGRLDAGSTFIATLRLAQEAPEQVNRLRTWLADRPAVQQAYYVTGEDDLLVFACARNVHAYERFMARLLQDNPVVLRYTTRVVLQTLKRGLAIPVGDTDG